MVIDIDKYSVNKDYAQSYWIDRGRGDLHYSIAMISSMTMVPCIVVAYWIGEKTGFTPEVIKAIQGYIDFYGYTEVQNKPEGAPI